MLNPYSTQRTLAIEVRSRVHGMAAKPRSAEVSCGQADGRCHRNERTMQALLKGSRPIKILS
jgi:uncharacterized low-complexity protein